MAITCIVQTQQGFDGISLPPEGSYFEKTGAGLWELVTPEPVDYIGALPFELFLTGKIKFRLEADAALFPNVTMQGGGATLMEVYTAVRFGDPESFRRVSPLRSWDPATEVRMQGSLALISEAEWLILKATASAGASEAIITFEQTTVAAALQGSLSASQGLSAFGAFGDVT